MWSAHNRLDGIGGALPIDVVMPYRVDAAELRTMTKDAYGFFRGEAFVSRVGIFEYFRNGKVVRELRPPEEVLHPESLESMALAPITLGHPSTPSQLIKTPQDAESRVVGAAGNPTAIGQEKIKASIMVHRADAIAAIESGIKQISPGYTCEYEDKPGTWNGKPYDGIQRKIRYNHHAIVKHGRQGADIGMRLDEADGYSTQLLEEEKGKTMLIKIGEDQHDVPDALAAGLRASVEKLVGRADALQVQLAGRADASQVQALVEARVQRVVEARELCGDKLPLEKLVRADEDEIVRAMVAHLAPSIDLTGKSKDYCSGILDTLRATKTARADEKKTADQGLVDLAKASAGAPRADATSTEVEKDKKSTMDAYEEMRKRNAEAWQKKIA